MADHLALARSFGRTADAYERVRPAFPAALIEQALTEIGVPAPATIVDLAPGPASSPARSSASPRA